MLNKLKEQNIKQINLKSFFVYTLSFMLLIILPHVLVTIISLGLPFLFEFLYTIWIQIFHFILPLIIILSSMLVILLPNPIYGLIALILVFLSTAVFLISMQIQFLAFIYLIIYIGAIAILFLFVIMLFNLRSLKKSDLKIKDFSFLSISFKLYFFFGVKFFLVIVLDIWNLIEYNSYINTYAVYNKFDIQYFLTYVNWDILLFGNLFYTYYSYLFIVSGLILLTSMVGSIVLALSTNEKTI